MINVYLYSRITEETPLEFADHLFATNIYQDCVNIPRAAVRYLVCLLFSLLKLFSASVSLTSLWFAVFVQL